MHQAWNTQAYRHRFILLIGQMLPGCQGIFNV